MRWWHIVHIKNRKLDLLREGNNDTCTVLGTMIGFESSAIKHLRIVRLGPYHYIYYLAIWIELDCLLETTLLHAAYSAYKNYPIGWDYAR